MIIAIDIFLLKLTEGHGIWWVVIILGVGSVLLLTSWLLILRDTLPYFQGYNLDSKKKSSEIGLAQLIAVIIFLGILYLFYINSVFSEY